MPRPHVSIIMPTLNSERTIERVLASIRGQTYGQDLIDILVIDGGSTDGTRKIAEKYGCKILENTKVQQEYAKHLGMLEAGEGYAMFLDSDEELANPEDIAIKASVLAANSRTMCVLGSGYVNPESSADINDYINCYSDPFAYFMFGISPEADTYWRDLKRKYECAGEDDRHVLLRFKSSDVLPLADMAAGAMLDLGRFRREFPREVANHSVMPRVFYILAARTGHAAVAKGCPVIHYSADTFTKYLNKIRWRVKVNIHYPDIPGTGYANREEFYSPLFNLKKYLFIPWSLTVLGPLAVSVRKWLRFRKNVLLLHAPLSFFTASYILYQYALAKMGKKPILKSYGSEEKNLEV